MGILSFVPLPYRLAGAGIVIAAAAGGVLAWGAHKDGQGYDRGTAEVTAKWTAEDLKRSLVAAAASEAARIEEQRRAAAQKEATDEADKKLARARADVLIADAASGRLQQRYAALLAAARGGQAPVDTGSAQPGPTADDAALLLAELQRRLDARAGELAQYADSARIAGQTCERAYDALAASASSRPE